MGQLSTFRKLSGKAKVQFIWDYYRWHILACFLIINAIAYTVHLKATTPVPVFNVAVIKTTAQTQEKEIDFTEYLLSSGFADTDTVSVNRNLTLTGELGTSYQSIQILHSLSFTGDVDVFLWTEDTICQYFGNGMTADVRDLLSEEAINHEAVSAIDTETDVPDEKYPCYIKLENNSWTLENIGSENCYLAFSCTPLNPDAARSFVDYLLQYSNLS